VAVAVRASVADPHPNPSPVGRGARKTSREEAGIRVIASILLHRFAAFGAVEQHPGDEVVAEIDETMLHAGRHEQ
jgi:hypothetical protein